MCTRIKDKLAYSWITTKKFSYFLISSCHRIWFKGVSFHNLLQLLGLPWEKQLHVCLRLGFTWESPDTPCISLLINLVPRDFFLAWGRGGKRGLFWPSPQAREQGCLLIYNIQWVCPVHLQLYCDQHPAPY